MRQGTPIVAIVDDDPRLLESLQDLLESAGYSACRFSSAEALLARGLADLDLIIADIGMPGMDGYAVARRMRRNPRLSGVKLIAVTGWGQDDDRRRSQEAGFDHHLTKPVDLKLLRRILDPLVVRSYSPVVSVPDPEAFA